MGMAHYFTVLRIVLSPFFPFFYLTREELGISWEATAYILLFLLIVCESSDWIDGIIARRSNQVTDLGKILDPTADSIVHISLFFTLTQGPVSLPIFVALIFFYREFFLSMMRTLCALRGVALAARSSGKIKTAMMASVLFCILVLMIFYARGILSLELLQKTSLIMSIVAAGYAVLSVFDYIWANREHLKKALE